MKGKACLGLGLRSESRLSVGDLRQRVQLYVCMLYIGGSPWLELDMLGGPEVILFYFIFM